MKIKEAMASEECKRLRIVLGSLNQLNVLTNKMCTENLDDPLHKVSALLASAQHTLCMAFGAKLEETLCCAQDIESEEGGRVTYVGMAKPITESDKAEPKGEDKK